LHRDDLATDPRFTDFVKRSDAADQLIEQVRKVFLTNTTEMWLARLHAADLIADRILNPGDWLRNPHVEATKAAVRSETPGVGSVYAARTPGTLNETEDTLLPAPAIGQHSSEVLRENGYDQDTVNDLITSGAVLDSIP
jgi:crotonobetainyl-CoA:carnitine CoA-transferase CaiB-like acyl-CoA transferase